MSAGGRTPAVVLLAHYFLPANTSGVQRALRFYRYLPEFGYDVHVVCAGAAGAAAGMENVHHVPDAAGEPGAAGARRMAALQRWFLPYDEKLPWAAHAAAAVERILEREPVAALISTSPPVATHLAAWWLRRRHGIPWLADFRDPILGNPGRPKRWARPYDRWLERRIFDAAGAVVAVSDAFTERWKRSYPRAAHKVHTLWNGFDPAEQIAAQPAPPRPHRELLHAGVLYWQRHPEQLLAALDRLAASGRLDPAALRLCFRGYVQNWERLAATAPVQRLLQRGMLELRPECSRQESLAEMAQADCLLLIDIVNDRGEGYTVPAKIFDYLRAGRPILALTTPGCPVDRILARSGVPYAALYPGDAPDAADEKVLRLLAEPPGPHPPSAWFFGQFDGRRQAGALAELLDGITR